MEGIVSAFTEGLFGIIPAEAIVFIISMLPILELRGGLIASVLLALPIEKAIIICIIGNIIPIPFILLFIKKIFSWMKKYERLGKIARFFEEKGMKRSKKVRGFEFLGLVLFVGIPLPGTGAWTGSLVASLLNMDIKKAILAELIGIAIATVIMAFISYGLIGSLIG